MKYEATITSIGSLADSFLLNNNSMVLLDEGIHPNLAEMVIQHTSSRIIGEIKPGDKATIGRSKFTVIQVGETANQSLNDEGHCTLVINAKGTMPGQIILEGPALPRLKVGDKITFS